MKNRHLYILAGALCFVGVGLFLYKVLFLELPLRPQEKVRNWVVEARLTFDAAKAPVKVSLFIPRNERSYTILDQSFLSEGYGLTTSDDGDNKRALFSIREADGPQTIYYRFVVFRSLIPRDAENSEDPVPIMPALGEAHMAAARGLINDLKAKSADDETLIRLVLKSLTATPMTDEVEMLLGLTPSTRTRVEVAAQMLATAGIAARPVNGILLANFNSHAPITHWLEANIDGQWQAFSARAGASDFPGNTFAWWRGVEPMVSVEGARNVKRVLTISATSVPALRNAVTVDRSKNQNILSYSLFSLPLDTQQVYRVILTVPLGVFILTLLRNVVGVQTFGTFMPVLIGIAFRETHLVWGVILFSLVVSIGLLARLYLENLRLLVVPRLTCVLIIVVLTMAGISVVSSQLGLHRGLSVALFPMVILTMTVERMSIIWDERGPAEMARLGIGSLAVAILVYFIMVNSYVEHICFVFPELLLIVLGFSMLLGRYSGFRLLDLPRFRVLRGRDR